MLCEVFCDNVREKYVMVELRKKHREEPSNTFVTLREYALQLSEEEDSQPMSQWVLIRQVESAVPPMGD